MKSRTPRDWLNELHYARKREDTYRKDADKTVRLYESERVTDLNSTNNGTPFNILYSNTETLSPALYNSPPRPEVNRRFRDEDPMGKIGSELVERTLSFLLDSEGQGYETFDEVMQSSVTQALVAGRGIVRFKYEAESPAGEVVDEKIEEDAEEDYLEQGSRLGETVSSELIPWDRFLHGYAQRWGQVPWIAFEHRMSKLEVEENFGKEVAAKLKYESDPEMDMEGKVTPGELPVCIYEVWDKVEKKVLFLSEAYAEEFLRQVNDPLNLVGFFPIARPLMLFRRISSLTPVPLYVFYEDQARELNQITVRIRRIILALKVRGFYDATIEGIEKLLTADDNTFLPAQNVAALQQGTSMEKSLFLMPIEKLITVLQQLYLQRQQVKQVIYDITGIADIMRGSTQASETLGAQEIKNQWGTLRLRKAQKEVARFARDNLRLMAEIAISKFAPETLLAMTGLKIPTQAELLQQQMMQQLQAMQAQGQPQAPMPGQPQAPAAPAPAQMGPSIEELQMMLQSDLLRSFHIDIETNSTIELEATQDKQDMAELMNAVAQFMNGIAPAVAQGILPFEAAKAMLLGIVRRFRFGVEVESVLEKMQQPPPKQEPQDAKNNPEVIQAEAQAHIVKAQSDLQSAQQEAQFKAQEHQLKMEELRMKQQMMLMQHDLKLKEMQMQTALAMSKPAGLSENNSGRKPEPKPSSSSNSKGN